jgi:hypothetical protein
MARVVVVRIRRVCHAARALSRGARVLGGVGALIQRLLGRSDIAIERSVYMRRWRLLHTRWLGVRVHQILRSDADRELHDHPFDFLSVILWGGYREQRADGERVCRAPALVWRRAETLHRLELLAGPTWTLVFRGPKRREWGFLTAAGWVHWKTFTAGKSEQIDPSRRSTIGGDTFNAPSSY